MDELYFKLICFLCIFACGLVGGFLPLRVVTSERYLSWANCFAAGVFLAAGLVHMLPDTEESFREHGAESFLGNLNSATCLISVGFILILFIEKVALGGHDALILAAAGVPEGESSTAVQRSSDNREHQQHEEGTDSDVDSAVIIEKYNHSNASSLNNSVKQKTISGASANANAAIGVVDEGPIKGKEPLKDIDCAWHSMSAPGPPHQQLHSNHLHVPKATTTHSDVRKKTASKRSTVGGCSSGSEETSPLLSVTSPAGSPDPYDQPIRLRDDKGRFLGEEVVDMDIPSSLALANNSRRSKGSFDYSSFPRTSCEKLDHIVSSVDSVASCTCELNTTKPAHIHRIEYYSKLFGQGMRAGMEVTQHLQRGGEYYGGGGKGRTAPKLEALEQSSRVDLMPYILMIALCFHSFLTGLVIGLNDNIDDVYVMLIAVVSHKVSGALALGISFLKAKVTYARYTKLIVLFSLFTPTGIVVGYLISASLSSMKSNLVSAVFTGIGAGTFLYLATCVMINEEFACGTDKWRKFAFLVLGFGGMAAVAIVE
eukprot:Nk52_evm11s2542 gene=Nk52_evmTU11s2542